jgi:hypothetical protein|tara:strand:+ start:4034 stop:5143 length:1110 start_codon:yes stop_codon:yes gene_type:complete
MLYISITLQIALFALLQDVPTNSVSDGPYIFHQEDGTLKSISVVEGKVNYSMITTSDGEAIVNTSIPSVPAITIAPVHYFIPKDTVPMPTALLAVSDLEGNLDHLLTFLQTHKVIDDQFDWSWGDNHLLFNGDSVDRGVQVTELLWFIRKLQRQSILSGGQVHFVLGNHDVMILANDIRYTHDKYKIVSEKTGIPYHELFSETSVLGKWLRNQNSAVQIGPYLFVHAGYGPELHKLQFSLTEINDKIRASIGPPAWPEKEDLGTSLAWNSKGPLWYRGYFEKHAEKYGPKPSPEELQAILDTHKAKAIIVGHTVTGNVGYLDGNKQLIGIDVHWDTLGEGEGLLITEGTLRRLTMDGSSKELLDIPTGK